MNTEKLAFFYYNQFSLRDSTESFESFTKREDRGSKKKYQKARFYQDFLKS